MLSPTFVRPFKEDLQAKAKMQVTTFLGAIL